MKNLDLTKILKDCPKGTEFYLPIYGTVKFIRIDEDENPIAIKWFDKNNNAYIEYLTKEGTYRGLGECIIFPSKDQRDWSKWQRPFVKGDVLVSKTGNIVLCSHIDEKQLVHYYCLLNPCGYLKIRDDVGVGYSFECTLATEEEKQKLFNALKENGYEWDAENKELKNIKPKFDISTLQPFDKVLVRDYNNSKWIHTTFGYIDKKLYDLFVCENDFSWNYCIPYNEETKHLLGTSQQAPEKYINW